MGDQSDIQWTDATANVVVGCSRVSEGCRHCYAERLAATRLKHTKRYEGLALVTESGKPQWTGETRIVTDALEQVLRWRKPRRIFLTAMGDPFHESLSNEQVAALFGVMAACPQHTFQVLTKRAKRMREWFEWLESETRWRALSECSPEAHARRWILHRATWALRVGELLATEAPDSEWPLPNVWLGVSVENQAAADERIPELLSTPAAVRFLSCEPLLGPVDLQSLVVGECERCGTPELLDGFEASVRCECAAEGAEPVDCERLDWVIVGGESGHSARPFDLAWARPIVEQCKRAEVPVFCKQLGAKPVDSSMVDILGPDLRVRHRARLAGDELVAEAKQLPGYSVRPTALSLRDSHGGDPSEWPEDLRVREFPKTGGAR